MKTIRHNNKSKLLLKSYVIIFSIINLVYVVLEVFRSRYLNNLSLSVTTEQSEMAFLMRIYKVTSSAEGLLILLSLAYLMIIYYQKSKINKLSFILINLGFFASLFLVSSLASLLFSAPIGNLTQQLFIPLGFTVIILIYFTGTLFYKKLLKR